MSESNTWLNEKGHSQIETFLADSDEFIVERARALELMIDIFKWNSAGAEGLSVLDLGCGDGRLSRIIAERFSHHAYHLLDGSAVMIEKAKERMMGFKAVFFEKTFERLIAEDPVDQQYDFVFSSMAIHHLELFDKQKLYGRIYRELKFGGLFLNYDVVLPVSERAEKWYFEMWRDWMNERFERNGKKEKKGRFDSLPENAKAKAENKPSRLTDHLQALEACGYRDVDCHYKYGVFCLYGGTKT
jgi:tRNA (cmo5U34)-methyltransferase